MKKIFLILAGLSLQTFAMAESSALRDLWYIQPKAKFSGESTGELSYYRNKIDGAPTEKSSHADLNQLLLYGFTNHFSLGVKGSYSWEHVKDGASENGFENPSVSAVYARQINNDAHLFVRGLIAVSPYFGKKTEHNELAGSTNVEAQFQMGQALGSWEYEILIGTVYASRAIRDAGNLKSHFDPAFAVLGQYDVSPFWSIDAQTKLAFPGALKNESTGGKTSFRYYHSIEIGPDWQFTPNLRLKLLAGAGNLAGKAENGAKFNREELSGSATLGYNFN